MDGEYEIRPRLTRDLNEGMPNYTEAQHLEISLDGERVGVFTLPGVSQRQALQLRKPRIPRSRRSHRSRRAFARARRIAPHALVRTKMEFARCCQSRSARYFHRVPQPNTVPRRNHAFALLCGPIPQV